MKFFLALATVCALFFQRNAYAETPTLRVVLAIDTLAMGGAGAACEEIGNSLDRVLEKAARKNNISYDRTNIYGLKISENTFYQHYAHHEVNREDTLLFYYCGHGLMHPGNQHIFAATGARVRRDYIRKLFSLVPAKLKIIATETCSSYDLDKHYQKRMTEDLEVASDLLFNASGNVDITAASPGQTAWYGDAGEGGMFTNAIINVFGRTRSSVDQNQDGRASWTEAFPLITEQTNTNFQALKKASPIIHEIQLAPSQDAYSWKLAD